MRKRLITVLLAGAMVMSLTACGGSNDSEKSSDSGNSNKLTVWAWDQNFNIKAMQIAGEQYKKDHPDFELPDKTDNSS